MNFEKVGRKSKLLKLYEIVDKNFKPLIFLGLLFSFVIACVGGVSISTPPRDLPSLFTYNPIQSLLSIFLVSFLAFLPVGVIIFLASKKQTKEEQIKKIEKGNLNTIRCRLSFKD